MAQNDSEWPILPNLQLFQSFPSKVTQNDSEWLILPDLQLFQSFPTEVAQNDSKWPILPNFQLLWPKHVIFGEISKIFIPWGGGHSSNFLIFSNFWSHFTPKRLKMAHDGKFCLKSCLLRWGKYWKVANQVELAIPIHSEPLRWEKNGKVGNQVNIGHSRSFWGTLVGKDLKSCKLGKIGHSGSF